MRALHEFVYIVLSMVSLCFNCVRCIWRWWL